MARLSRSLLSFSSRCFASRIADEALNASKGLASWSVPVTGVRVGVEKSISTPSPAVGFGSFSSSFSGPRSMLRTEDRLRVSSKGGMGRRGETGIVGLRIDFKGKAAID